MLNRETSARTRKAPGMTILSLLVSAAILGVSLGAVAWWTVPDRAHRRAGAPSGRAAVPGDLPPAGEAGARPAIPLYSEGWVDDSGASEALTYSRPIADPQSLEQVRARGEGRADRGIDRLREVLAAVDRRTADGRAQAIRLNLVIGCLKMSAGEFVEADRHFAEAQGIDRNGPGPLLANIEAMRGVAAMRRGEAENCVACCNEASCIFPLAREAVHRKPSGSRDAVAHFTRYLERRPEDLGVRWLLNVASMTLGEYPEGVPAEYLIPLGPFRGGGDVGRMTNVAARVGLAARGENMAGGMIVDDFTGDGRLDVFTTTMDPAQACSLFVNLGDGRFEDRSEKAGLADQVGALNGNHADYDNDGDLDVLVLRGAWEAPQRPSLLRNEGDGTFADVTIPAGLCDPIASQAAGWADYDLDGFVDLYIGGEFKPDDPDPANRGRLYRNNGDGTFTDVAGAAGVENERFGKGVAWGDYDNDGLPDLYVSNRGQGNRLYRNNGDGTFTDVAERLGVSEPRVGFACWFWDCDNDGRLDLFAAGYSASLSQVIRSQLGLPTDGERPRLYRNEGDRFADVTAEAGLDRVWLPMGSNIGDVDNDGYLDIYLGSGAPPYSDLMPNVLLHSVGGRRFEDVTVSSGTGHLQKGHGVAFADWDRDGDVDLFVEAGGATPGDKAHNLLFENPGHGRNWVALKLVGTRSNRSAIGAKVRVDVTGPAGSRSIHRVIGGSSSFGDNPLAPTIGLGEAESIAAVEVRWPRDGGAPRVVHGVPLDRAVQITEGDDGYLPLDWTPIAPPGPKIADTPARGPAAASSGG
jgi:hypothetical protein